MIQVVHPGSGSQIQILICYPSRVPDPGVKKAPDHKYGLTTGVPQTGGSVINWPPGSGNVILSYGSADPYL